MGLQSTYEKNVERIKTLKPNCAQRFLKFLDACWQKKLYFIIPKEGALRTEEDQLLLLTKGRTKEEIEKTYRKLGLTIDQLTKIRTLYIQKKNVIADRPVTWTFYSEHLKGLSIDCLPAIVTNTNSLDLIKDAIRSKRLLQEMQQISITQNLGVYRSPATLKVGDYAHFTAYDLPVFEKDLSALGKLLIAKKEARMKDKIK